MDSKDEKLKLMSKRKSKMMRKVTWGPPYKDPHGDPPKYGTSREKDAGEYGISRPHRNPPPPPIALSAVKHQVSVKESCK
ncbi:hypothetical protein ACFXTH_006210 [Malus domestica]